MRDAELTARIAAVPLCADLDAAELDELVGGMRRVSFAPGEELMRQGALPDGAYFLIGGRVQILTKLPGGGETLIAELESGSTVGELALIRKARRAATVRAIGRVEAVYADPQVFRAALVQLRPTAIKVLRRLALILSERLRLLHGRIHDAVRADPLAYAPMVPPAGPGAGSVQRGAPAGFDYARFLPILPCFRGFDPDQIRSTAEHAQVLAMPRGAPLLSAAAAPEACYLVVRGAIASGFVDGGRMHQLNVLGPGRFCAVGSLIENRPASACYVARETSVLLEFSRSAFLDLYLGYDRLALNLLRAVNEHQADMVARADNHLTRLVGLTRLSRQGRGGGEVST